MKIIFIGAVEFSLHMLTVLLNNKVEIAGVVTAEDRGINSDYADLVPLCREYNIPVLSTNDVNSVKTVNWIRNLELDVIFCMGWSRVIKSELLQLPPLGVIGYHPAPLPKNRGRHPLIWALVLGLKETASTFFFMDEGIDSGHILSQKDMIISVHDDAKSLYTKMVETAKAQILVLVSALSSGQYERFPQDHSKANFWRKRNVKDGEIDWRMSAKSIHNLVRGLTHPYIGAHLECNGEEFKVWKSRVIDCPETDNIEPGKVLDITKNATVTVKCGEGCIQLLEIDPPMVINIGDYL